MFQTVWLYLRGGGCGGPPSLSELWTSLAAEVVEVEEREEVVERERWAGVLPSTGLRALATGRRPESSSSASLLGRVLLWFLAPAAHLIPLLSSSLTLSDSLWMARSASSSGTNNISQHSASMLFFIDAQQFQSTFFHH